MFQSTVNTTQHRCMLPQRIHRRFTARLHGPLRPAAGLRSPPLAELAKRQAHSDPEMPALDAGETGGAPADVAGEPGVEAISCFELVHWGRRQLLEELDLRQTEQRLALVHAANAQATGLRSGRQTFSVQPARAPMFERSGPYAFSRGIPVAQKCNRAVHCGSRPFPLDVVGCVISANLLAVTIDAAVRGKRATAFDHSDCG
jgi:hypothetical protein